MSLTVRHKVIKLPPRTTVQKYRLFSYRNEIHRILQLKRTYHKMQYNSPPKANQKALPNMSPCNYKPWTYILDSVCTVRIVNGHGQST